MLHRRLVLVISTLAIGILVALWHYDRALPQSWLGWSIFLLVGVPFILLADWLMGRLRDSTYGARNAPRIGVTLGYVAAIASSLILFAIGATIGWLMDR
jgi:hypothetical protein